MFLNYNDDIPLFFGHYWVPPENLITEKANRPAVCLDYNIACKGGCLAALRFNGSLDESKWFVVERC